MSISQLESDGVPDSEADIVHQTEETQIMTRQQVAAKKNKILIIYKNEVFDVGNYVNLHPGGPNYILEYAGRDVSIEFDQVGHSLNASNHLKHFKIGAIHPDDIADVNEVTE